MRFAIWNGNVERVEQHGLTVEDVEYVLAKLIRKSTSRSTGLPCAFGYTPEGVFIIVVYDVIDEETVYPVSAYEVEED